MNLRRIILLQCFCNNLDPVYRIQTKFGMNILLDPRDKPEEEFFIFLKIQDGRRRSKICDALYFFNVFAITWIRFIGSRQNLAWTYYLTLGFKMAPGGHLVSRVKLYVHAKFSRNELNRVQVIAKTLILLGPPPPPLPVT